MASTRRLVSYDDIDYGAAPVASTSASARTAAAPAHTKAVKQEAADASLQPSLGASLNLQAPLASSQDPRAASPGSSTNEGSLSYAKKKRLRRKRQLEAKQPGPQQPGGQRQEHNPQKRQVSTSIDGIDGHTGVDQGKKRRRNEDNKLQRASLRQEMEEQWMGNGAAMGGLDYDGLTGEGTQDGVRLSEAESSAHAANGNVIHQEQPSADQSTAEGWKEAQGDDGWGDEDEQEYDEEGELYEDNGEPYDEDEEHDESIQAEWDAMGRLNTSIAIPDIPPAFLDTGYGPLGNASQARLEQASDVSPPNTNAMAADEGRVLTEAELWDESALVDAWKAATEEYLLHSSKGPTTTTSAAPAAKHPSALWHDAPVPGSKAAQKAQQISENNKEKRRLRLFLEEKARKAREIEDLRQEVEKEQAQAQEEERQRQRQQEQAGIAEVSMTPAPAPPAPPSALVSSTSNVATAKVHPAGKRSLTGRAIPPSIGLPGNAAWQAACATVASTRNRIGDEARPPLAPPRVVEKAAAQPPAKVAASVPEPISTEVPTTADDTAMSVDQSASDQAPNGTGIEVPQALAPSSTSHSNLPLPQPPMLPPALSHPHLASQAIPPLPPGAAGSDGPLAIASGDGSASGELLQRICTSWYYAGYWTAQWEEEGRRRSRGERKE